MRLFPQHLPGSTDLVKDFVACHLPAIVAVSCYVVHWQTDVAVKILVAPAASQAFTPAIVELIRRIAPLRRVAGTKAPRLPGGPGALF